VKKNVIKIVSKISQEKFLNDFLQNKKIKNLRKRRVSKIINLFRDIFENPLAFLI